MESNGKQEEKYDRWHTSKNASFMWCSACEYLIASPSHPAPGTQGLPLMPSHYARDLYCPIQGSPHLFRCWKLPQIPTVPETQGTGRWNVREKRNKGTGSWGGLSPEAKIALFCWEYFASTVTEQDLKGKRKWILKAALLGKTNNSGGSSLLKEFYL